MFDYARTWLALRSDKRGVTAMEYGLIAALIAVVIIVSVTAVGTHLQTVFNGIEAALVPAA
jgi:pilus assembly protein Flp/PilA